MKSFEFLYLILILKAAAPAGTPVPPAAGLHSGHLLITSEAEVFRPCGSDYSLWLDYASGTRATVIKNYRHLRAGPNAETYVVLRGAPGPQLECGYCGKYPGSFKVDAVIEHKTRAPATCG